ncbi:hypothetical protein ACOMHN_048241 [Nucella lapillus]
MPPLCGVLTPGESNTSGWHRAALFTASAAYRAAVALGGEQSARLAKGDFDNDFDNSDSTISGAHGSSAADSTEPHIWGSLPPFSQLTAHPGVSPYIQSADRPPLGMSSIQSADRPAHPGVCPPFSQLTTPPTPSQLTAHPGVCPPFSQLTARPRGLSSIQSADHPPTTGSLPPFSQLTAHPRGLSSIQSADRPPTQGSVLHSVS